MRDSAVARAARETWEMHPAAAAVEERLIEAARTMRRLSLTPRDKPMDYVAAWPDTVQSVWEAGLDPDGKPVKPRPVRIAPSPQQIDRMNEAIEWLFALEAAQRKLVWARAMRVRWKELEFEFGLSRQWLSRRYKDALLDIVMRAGKISG
jgi:hypothetical protein